MLLAGLAAPAAGNSQYGAWPSGHAAGSTYKQAYGKASHGSFGQYGGSQGGGFRGYGRHGAPRRVWVAGHWSLREHNVWVAGRTERCWRPARFETRFDACGLAYRIQVHAGYYETVQHPGGWERRTQRVWVAGCWSQAR